MDQLHRNGSLYGTGSPARQSVQEVLRREFDVRRRGVDPDQVRLFQVRVADELAALHREAWLLRQENDRLKDALRDWQSRHARQCRVPPERPSTDRHR